MKYTSTFCLILPLILWSVGATAQKISSEDMSYFYKRLPIMQVSKDVKNYQLYFDPVYETKNQSAVKVYELALASETERYKREMAVYPSLLRQANNQYEIEMAEYNKKSFGKKLLEKQLLEQNNKPVKNLPVKPVMKEIERPPLQSSYDYNVLASTYIKFEGFEESTSNALKVHVLLYGFDFTQPRTVNADLTSFSTRSSTGTSNTTYYHIEFSYRHPMALKVTTPEGKELLSVTPPELNLYETYKGADTDRPTIVNKDLLIKNMEEKILQDNLKFINNMLNDKFGYSWAKRTSKLFFVKNGGAEYNDLTAAFNEAIAGFSMLQQDSESAKQKINNAAEIWNKALQESDLNNKKARIHKELTMVLYNNLLEAYFALGNVQGGKALLNKMNGFSLSFNERKTKNEYETLFTDLKIRQQNN